MAHSEAMERLGRVRDRAMGESGCLSRRGFLGAAAAALPVWGAKAPNLDVGIVGAGLAGLVCGDRLKRAGLRATVYDATGRAGGRCYSLRGYFPGQVAERGGEFIDTGHKTMIAYAREFGLTLEDVNKNPGEIRYSFFGQVYPEAAVVEEFRVLVDAMRDDLRRLSGEVTARSYTPADEAVDRTSLSEYLASRGAGRLVKAVIEEAYVAEYGLEPGEQSALNFLFFIHADRRSKFTPFGVFSDERYHVVEGNDAIAAGIAGRLSGQVRGGLLLQAVRKTAGGRIELTFREGNRTVTAAHDAVVLAVPFTALRRVALDASLGLSAQKLAAIRNLGYGMNAKMMIGFRSRPWYALHGSNGASYADLENCQTTWETNPVNATAGRAVLTDYSGGVRGERLNPSKVQWQAARFLGDLNRVYPGADAAATRDGQGNVLAHLEHWPSNPLTMGSYTCYKPGQFTTIAGLEGEPAGNLFFAGEHADSFYSWQGFMEGACLSGIAAAGQVLG